MPNTKSAIRRTRRVEIQTQVNRVYHLDRGYEKIEETLGKCGPSIIREK